MNTELSRYQEATKAVIANALRTMDITIDAPGIPVYGAVSTELGVFRITIEFDPSIQRGTEWDR